MHKKLKLDKYLNYIIFETLAFLLMFYIIMTIVIALDPKTTLQSLYLWCIAVTSFGYSIVKHLSLQFKNDQRITLLPISYLLGFYGLQFLMILTNSTTDVNYTPQLNLLTLIFIAVNVIDKVLDHYFKEK
ncbi:hypothetical protein NYE79_05640 [Streptococcus sp. FSL W8-0197]|jgi:hypothetical protein|uniref:hypothetical protein n=1 Tax=Streptococcus TaxID=1301 RepID=UPI0020C933A3|nr:MULTISPECIES: hypothetical protein [Streptococcus]MCP9082662.1 hypothetical protein [Streptococcus sp. CF10-1]MCY7084736.1 hypothetical protein [Streptococcus oralis]